MAVDAGTAGDRELSEGKFAESNTFGEFSSDLAFGYFAKAKGRRRRRPFNNIRAIKI